MAQKLKAKHQDRVWVDGDGDVWFFDVNKNKWRYLAITEDGVEYISENAAPNIHHGPYTAIHAA